MNGLARDTAGSADGGPGPGRYLIGVAEGGMFAELADLLSNDDRVRVVGRPTASVLAVETAAPVVEELRAWYGDRLIIEPDLELDSLSPVGTEDPGVVTPQEEIQHD